MLPPQVDEDDEDDGDSDDEYEAAPAAGFAATTFAGKAITFAEKTSKSSKAQAAGESAAAATEGGSKKSLMAVLRSGVKLITLAKRKFAVKKQDESSGKVITGGSNAQEVANQNLLSHLTRPRRTLQFQLDHIDYLILMSMLQNSVLSLPSRLKPLPIFTAVCNVCMKPN